VVKLGATVGGQAVIDRRVLVLGTGSGGNLGNPALPFGRRVALGALRAGRPVDNATHGVDGGGRHLCCGDAFQPALPDRGPRAFIRT
jgi:hypothetical protein